MGSTRRIVLSAVAVCYAVAFFWPAYDRHNGSIEVDLAGANLSYCHQVDFPKAWTPFATSDPHEFGDILGYKFRQGSTPQEVLVAGYTSELDPWVTRTKYRVNLAPKDRKPELVDAATWDAAPEMAWNERRFLDDGKPLGPEVVKSGDVSAEEPIRVSSDQQWVVLQSYTQSRWNRLKVFTSLKYLIEGLLLRVVLAPFLRIFPPVDTIYLDAYSISGRVRVATLKGRLYGTPDHINRTGWLGAYFLAPTGPRYERLLVCDFSKAAKP